MKAEVKSLLNGLMVYWDEVEEAARYYVHLLIGYTPQTKTQYQEIAVIEVPRNIKYHSFTDLAKIDQEEAILSHYHASGKDTHKNYFIYVEAEDRTGKIIAKTEKQVGKVYVMFNGYYSLSN